MVLISESKFGTKAQSINEIAERLCAIDWYKNVGKKERATEEAIQCFMQKLQVQDYEIKWITKEYLTETISKLTFENSNLWAVLAVLPDILKRKIDEADQADLLNIVVDTVPQEIFHIAFEKSFQVFSGEKQINFFVGQAMYIAILVCSAQIAGEVDLFTPLIEFLETGHVPVGVEGNTIYLL